MILNKINNPEDLKKLKIEELDDLSIDVRNAILNRVSKIGGHIGPNLGVVELTIALHYVFDSPIDKFVFDVSHQSYAHKILTGRKASFLDDKHFNETSGFTNYLESPHDIFSIGHTSTSISLALGLAKGRDISKRKENIIAIIGDGSLSGGEALEGLDYAGEYKNNLIIIVNDNNQSIASNHGGLYESLKDLRDSKGSSSNNIFKAFNLDYMYLDEGHNIKALIEVLNKIKDIDHPIVLHVHTEKGHGLAYATVLKEKYHQGGPFNIETGEFLNNKQSEYVCNLTYSLTNLLDNDEKAVLLNAATPGRLGFSENVRKKYEENGQFIDVGIAEEHATAMISGIAKNGGRPIFGTLAAFLQRIYDQLSHDVCLNNSPAVILSLLGGVYGLTSNTHIALSDIPMFSHIPNLVLLAPTNFEEYMQVLDFSMKYEKHPVMIRVPATLKKTNIKDDTDYSILNKYKTIYKGSKILIIGVSNMIDIASDVRNEIKDKYNKDITVVNPIYLSGLDEEYLIDSTKTHDLYITIEDSYINGGYGQRIASFLGDSDVVVKNFGISNEFHTDFKPEELLIKHKITVNDIIDYIKSRGLL